MAAGRPTKYCPELAARFCKLLSTHVDGIRKLCSENDDLPADSTIRIWAVDNAEFSAMYWHAVELQNNFIAAEMREIATRVSTYIDPNGNTRIDPPSVAQAKNEMDALKWQSERLNSKRWGNKQRDAQIEQQSETLNKLSELVAQLANANKSDV